MENIITKIGRFFCYAVKFIFAAAVLFIFVMSLMSICYLNDAEYVYFCRDTALKQLLFIAVVTIAVAGLSKIAVVKKLIDVFDDEKAYKKAVGSVVILSFILGLIWMLSTQYLTIGDPRYVMEAAQAMHMGDYSMFKEGGYVHMYTNQTGLVLIEYLLGFILGGRNYMAFQLINVISYSIVINEIAWNTKRMGFRNFIAVMAAGFGIIYLPILFLISYSYGTLSGLAASLLAFRLVQLYLEKIKPALTLTGAVLLTFTAILLKNNYLIFALGLLCYLVLYGFLKKSIKVILPTLLIIVSIIVASKLPGMIITSITGEDMSRGSASISWMVMGISDEGYRAPGWFSGYNTKTYADAGYDPEVQKEIVKRDLQERLSEFKENPIGAIDFFVRKNTSQWCDPLFQTLWVVDQSDETIDLPFYQWYLRSAKGAYEMSRVMNYLHLLILFGSLVCALAPADIHRRVDLPEATLEIKRNNKWKFTTQQYLKICFIGGFIFHTIWEAKGRYTISYMVLLVPFAVAGIAVFARSCHEVIEEKSIKGDNAYFSMLIAVFIATGVLHLFGAFKNVTYNWDNFAQYLEIKSAAGTLEEGEYIIKSEAGGYLSAGEKISGKRTATAISDNAAEAIQLVVRDYEGRALITTKEEGRYLSSYLELPDDTVTTVWSKADYSEKQRWKLEETSEGVYRIINDERVLTLAEDGSLILQKDEEKPEQRFRFE